MMEEEKMFKNYVNLIENIQNIHEFNENNKQAIINSLYSEIVSKLYFSKEINWEKIKEDSKLIQKTTCGKPIKEGELCFQCMDCAILKENHLFCESCFINVDHNNHRLKFKNNIWGYCDCGDEDATMESSFCNLHKSKIINEVEIRKKVPKILRKKIKEEFDLMFFIYFHLIEYGVIDQQNGFNVEIEKSIMIKLELIFEVLSKLVDDSFSVLLYVANYLIKPFKKNEQKYLFFHECEYFQEIKFNYEKKLCKCSILGIIFKFNRFIPVKTKEIIVNLIYKLSPSRILKENILYLMQKNVYNIICLRSNDVEGSNEKLFDINISELTRLHLFYIINKDMAEKFIFSKYFYLITEKIRNEYKMLDSPNHEEFSNSIRNTIHFFLWKFANITKIIFLFFENPEIFQEILKIFLSTKPKTQFCKTPLEISILQTNYAFFLFIKKMIKILNEHENFERKNNIMTKIFGNIVSDIFLCSCNERKNLFYLKEGGLLFNDIHFMNNVATKIFGLQMSFFFQNFDYDIQKLREFLFFHLKNAGIPIEKFMEALTSEVILSEYSKYLINKNKDVNENNKDLINSNFSVSSLCFEAFDRFTLKIIFLLNENSIYENPVMKFLFPDQNKDENLEFFLDLMNTFIFDDISIINTFNATKYFKISELDNPAYPSKNLQFLIANFFLIEPNFDYEPFKKFLPKIKKKQIDELIEKISIFNQVKNSYELKDDYKNCFDLTAFPETWQFYSELYEKAKDLTKQGFSLILGNHDIKFQENTFFSLTMNQILESKFINVIFEFFMSEKHENNYDAWRKILKLVFFFLQNFAHHNKILGYCQNSYFKKRVDDLKSKKINQDFDVATEKIHNILAKMFLDLKSENNVSSEHPKAKSFAELNKQKILQEFKKKNEKFLAKFQDTSEKEQKTLVVEENNNNICCFCLQSNLKADNILGMSAYFSRDNIKNFLNINTEKTVLKRGKNYILSCGHMVHRECHFQYLIKKKSMFDLVKYFDYENEFVCSYCKSFSNIIVPNIESSIQTSYIEILENSSQENFNNQSILEIVSNLQFKKERTNNLIDLKYQTYFDNFFSDLIMTNGCSDNYIDISAFEILNESLMEIYEKLFYKDLNIYINNELRLTQNLFYLSLFWLYHNEDKSIIESLKRKLLKNLTELFYYLENFDQNLNMNKLLFRFCGSLFILRLLLVDDPLLIPLFKSLICDFMSHLLIICFIKYNVGESECSTKNLVSFFKNNEIRSKTFNFMGPFLTVIIGFLLSSFKISNKYEGLLQKFMKDNDYENSDLYKEFENILFPNEHILEKSINKWKNHFCSKHNSDVLEHLNSKIKISNNMRTFTILNINNYDEFLVKYMSIKCYKCKFFPKKFQQKLFMCLICDLIMCDGQCMKEDYYKNFGNLTEHTNEIHEGKCAFMNLIDGIIIVIKYPLIIINRSAFANKHGEYMKENDMNFSQYLLDKKYINRWLNSLANKKLHQEIIHFLSIHPESFHKNPDWKKI